MIDGLESASKPVGGSLGTVWLRHPFRILKPHELASLALEASSKMGSATWGSLTPLSNSFLLSWLVVMANQGPFGSRIFPHSCVFPMENKVFFCEISI